MIYKLLLYVTFGAFLFGCQTSDDRARVSLDEAKKLSVEFEKFDVQVPPSTLKDLGELPNRLSEVNALEQCGLRTIKASPASVRKIVSVMRKSLSDGNSISQYISDLATAEHQFGNLSNAITYQRESIGTCWRFLWKLRTSAWRRVSEIFGLGGQN